MAVTLTYMRHNRTQAEIGESLGTSQPTISRAISAITPLIPEATREFVPTADDLDPDAQYILDGTLLPCWSWTGRKELYSGKHKTTGMNVQVTCTIYGNPKNWIGDKGYIGNNMITPFRKPADGDLPPAALPRVGSVTGVPAYYEAVCHSGVILGPLVGRKLAEAISEPGRRFSLSPA